MVAGGGRWIVDGGLWMVNSGGGGGGDGGGLWCWWTNMPWKQRFPTTLAAAGRRA